MGKECVRSACMWNPCVVCQLFVYGSLYPRLTLSITSGKHVHSVAACTVNDKKIVEKPTSILISKNYYHHQTHGHFHHNDNHNFFIIFNSQPDFVAIPTKNVSKSQFRSLQPLKKTEITWQYFFAFKFCPKVLKICWKRQRFYTNLFFYFICGIFS